MSIVNKKPDMDTNRSEAAAWLWCDGSLLALAFCLIKIIVITCIIAAAATADDDRATDFATDAQVCID